MSDSVKLKILPLTPDLWPALEDLFGKDGACHGCWCMYWRIGAAYRRRPPQENKAAFRKIVKHGPPPGLLAFDRDLAVGWCQLTPRDDLTWFPHEWRLRPVDGNPVWSISCMYVRKGYRRRGVSSALITAAVNVAKQCHAPALEAYPFDADVSGTSSSTGYASAFERAGFHTVARHIAARPIMRHDLKPIRRSRSGDICAKKRSIL